MPQILSKCIYAPSACLKHDRGHDEHWHIIKEWLMICGLDWFGNFHYVWWRWEDADDRVVSWFGWKKGSENQWNVASASSRICWGVPDFAISKYLSHAIPSANTLVAGKQNFIHQLNPISSGSPCRLVVLNFCFAHQRERGELHRKVFWFQPGMVEFQQGFLSFLIEDYAWTMIYETGTDLVTIR